MWPTIHVNSSRRSTFDYHGHHKGFLSFPRHGGKPGMWEKGVIFSARWCGKVYQNNCPFSKDCIGSIIVEKRSRTEMVALLNNSFQVLMLLIWYTSTSGIASSWCWPCIFSVTSKRFMKPCISQFAGIDACIDSIAHETLSFLYRRSFSPLQIKQPRRIVPDIVAGTILRCIKSK